jgi:hypothetical protein
MYCPPLEWKAFTRAYEVTYSFEGPPLASDEYGNRRSTFSVYFRPEDLSAEEWAALMRRGARQAEAAGFFKLSTSKMVEERLVVDEDNSTLCAGKYSDGSWGHTEPHCEDHVNFKKATVPSEYLTLEVDLAPSSSVAPQ